ncbi:FAD-dependent oxidoreductase [bacterium]|nr:FAD-dependent oxidoreductase [bacterium]
MGKQFDVSIIGTGPAGLTAGIYTSRAKLSTILIEKQSFGGYITNIELVDNYPGLANISGQELSANMLTQIRQYDVRFAMAEAMGIIVDDGGVTIETDVDCYECGALIIASGAYPQKLDIPGEEKLLEKGIFYCATCDGTHFQDKVVAVAGGGDSALTEALNLTRICSEVIIIEILPELTGTGILRDKVLNHPKIDVLCGVQIVRINGEERVKSLDLLDLETQSKGTLDVDGILIHIGRKPNTDFLNGVVPLSEDGFILVNDLMETKISGIFAAGDVRCHSPMQIISACGDGSIAAMSVIKKIGTR